MNKPHRRMEDLTDALCRKYRITRPGWDPECIHARPLTRDRALLRCVEYDLDPLLEADCRGCPSWEPPDAEPEDPAAQEAAK